MGNPASKKPDQERAAETIKKAGERWPSSFVPRSQVPKFTGGLIAVGTIANADSLGRGPEDSFRIGRQKCYPVDALCNWLIGRLEA